MVNHLRNGERWLAPGVPPPAKPWWADNQFDSEDMYDIGELLADATELYEALVALRAESAWEQRLEMTRFKTAAEVAADAILDKVVGG